MPRRGKPRKKGLAFRSVPKRVRSAKIQTTKCDGCGEHFARNEKLLQMPSDCTRASREAWLSVFSMTATQYKNRSRYNTPRLCHLHFEASELRSIDCCSGTVLTKAEPTALPTIAKRFPHKSGHVDVPNSSVDLQDDQSQEPGPSHDRQAVHANHPCSSRDYIIDSMLDDKFYDWDGDVIDDEYESATSDLDHSESVDGSLYQPSEHLSTQNSESTTVGLSPLEEYSSVLRKKGLVAGKKFIVDESQLVRLFCMNGCSCGASIDPANVTIAGGGAEMSMKWQCSNVSCCRTDSDRQWTNTRPASRLNTAICASMTLCPLRYSQMERFADAISLQIPSRAVFDSRQRSLIFPEINRFYEAHMSTELENLQKTLRTYDMDFTVAGDCAYDSAGHNATWGTYTFMNMEYPNKIIASETLRRTDEGVDNVSSRMELVGFRKGLKSLQQFNVKRVVTDQNASIVKIMREEFPEIEHSFDVWHWVKTKVNLSFQHSFFVCRSFCYP